MSISRENIGHDNGSSSVTLVTGIVKAHDVLESGNDSGVEILDKLTEVGVLKAITLAIVINLGLLSRSHAPAGCFL